MPSAKIQPMCAPSLRSSETGAVLIIALFVLAVAAIMIVGFTSEYLLSVRRSENQRLADQVRTQRGTISKQEAMLRDMVKLGLDRSRWGLQHAYMEARQLDHQRG